MESAIDVVQSRRSCFVSTRRRQMISHKLFAGFVVSLGLGLLSTGCLTEEDVGEDDAVSTEISSVDPADSQAEASVMQRRNDRTFDDAPQSLHDRFIEEPHEDSPGGGYDTSTSGGSTSSGSNATVYPSFFCPLGCNSVNCQSFQCVNVGFMSCSCRPW